ncbi:UNVERIFIED_CONTAM: hypothetical protein FKN15_000555 [Acipenser sinensis]
MGQCVTKCKNPSSSLGSKSGDKEPGGKSQGKKSHKEELGPGKASGDPLVNGTKKMEVIEAMLLPAPSGDTRKEDLVSNGDEFSVHRIEELFKRYKDEQDDEILEEGMESFCDDLCVDPAEFRVLVLAWKFQAATMCKFTRSPLVNGTKKMEVIEAMLLPAPSGDTRKEDLVSNGDEFSVHRIEELFKRYKDEQDDEILEEGMESFCDDLCVDPAEFRVLVLAWKFQAATMCKFTRKEFVEGCKAIKADSLEGIHTRFPCLLMEAKMEDKFKDLYRFTFQFGLDSDEGQRSLHREIAIALWRLVFTQNTPSILEQWLDFLTENPSGVKGISRDTWNMFLNFSQVIGTDLSNYSEDEAWPSLFDTFVEWELERRKKVEQEKNKCTGSTSSTESLAQDQQN